MFEQLASPFPPEVVSWRVGSTNRRNFEAGKATERKGQALAYIDARDVMNRLDQLLTPSAWQARYVPMPNGTTCCELGIRVDGEWIWKANGAGATGDTSKETDREMAEKGAYSDALKRAAVVWGIGRYLYDLDAPWVKLNEYWQIDKPELLRLRDLLPSSKTVEIKSAYKARKDGDYPRLEAAIRAASSIEELSKLWSGEYQAIMSMPNGWREKLCEEKDVRKALLMGNVA